MNPVINAQVREYQQINALDSLSDEEVFELYSIHSILNGGLGESVDPADAHLNGCEFGIDGLAILVQGRLVMDASDAEDAILDIKNPQIDFYFFQSKTSASFDYGNISKFYDAIDGFFNDSMRGESPQLDDLIDAKSLLYEKAIGRRNPGLYAYYVSTGNYEKPARIENLTKSTLERWSDLNIFDADRIESHMVGAKQLQQLYRAASSAVEATIDFPRNVVLPMHESVEEAYLGYLTAEEVLKLVEIRNDPDSDPEINRAVFFDNIRDFDPDSKINEEISRTLVAGESSDFIFRNNGITVVAKTIDRTGDRFRIEDYQIVNGCQTSNIIFNNRDSAIGANIPFRLIGTKDDAFISSIIAGTNRQNPVREEQFWALRPFMKNFEEYCRSVEDDRKIFFERRENQFRGQKVEKARIVQPSTLMKVVAATLLNQPNRSARDHRGISAEYEKRLFLEDHDVRLYYASCYLNYRLDYLWRNQKLDSSLKIFRYYILSAVGIHAVPRKDVFSLKKSEIENSVSYILQLAEDELRLKAAIDYIYSMLSDQIDDLEIVGRERLRDAIRSETFAKSFHSTLTASDIDLFDPP